MGANATSGLIVALIGLLFFLAAAETHGQTNLLQNGDFEVPVAGEQNGANASLSPTGWESCPGNIHNVVKVDGPGNYDHGDAGPGSDADGGAGRYLETTGGYFDFWQEFTAPCDVRVDFGGHFANSNNEAGAVRLIEKTAPPTFDCDATGTKKLTALAPQDFTWNKISDSAAVKEGQTYIFAVRMGSKVFFDNGFVEYTSCQVSTPPSNSNGDVHMRTPDGQIYDFQAAGEFVLVRSPDKKVVVQARQEKWPDNPRVTVNTAVAMDVNGDRVEIHAKPAQALYINGKDESQLSGLTKLTNGGFINVLGTASRPYYLVEWPDGFKAGAQVYPNRMDIGVAKPPGTQTKYEGLVGDLDGNPDNDYKVRGGEVLTPPIGLRDLYERFGNSWRIPEAGPSLFQQGTHVAYDPPEDLYSLRDLSAEERQTGEDACKGIKATILNDNCVLDVGTTGDLTFVESAEAMQESGPVTEVRGDVLPTSDELSESEDDDGLMGFAKLAKEWWVAWLVFGCLLVWRLIVRRRAIARRRAMAQRRD